MATNHSLGLRKFPDVHTTSVNRICFSVRDEYNRQEICRIFCDSPEEAIQIAKAKKMSIAPIIDLMASRQTRDLLAKLKSESLRQQ